MIGAVHHPTTTSTTAILGSRRFLALAASRPQRCSGPPFSFQAAAIGRPWSAGVATSFGCAENVPGRNRMGRGRSESRRRSRERWRSAWRSRSRRRGGREPTRRRGSLRLRSRGVARAATRRSERPQGRAGAGLFTFTPRAGPRDARSAAPPELTFTSLEGLWRLEAASGPLVGFIKDRMLCWDSTYAIGRGDEVTLLSILPDDCVHMTIDNSSVGEPDDTFVALYEHGPPPRLCWDDGDCWFRLGSEAADRHWDYLVDMGKKGESVVRDCSSGGVLELLCGGVADSGAAGREREPLPASPALPSMRPPSAQRPPASPVPASRRTPPSGASREPTTPLASAPTTPLSAASREPTTPPPSAPATPPSAQVRLPTPSPLASATNTGGQADAQPRQPQQTQPQPRLPGIPGRCRRKCAPGTCAPGPCLTGMCRRQHPSVSQPPAKPAAAQPEAVTRRDVGPQLAGDSVASVSGGATALAGAAAADAEATPAAARQAQGARAASGSVALTSAPLVTAGGAAAPAGASAIARDPEDAGQVARLLVHGLIRVLMKRRAQGKGALPLNQVDQEFMARWKKPFDFTAAGESTAVSLLQKWSHKVSLARIGNVDSVMLYRASRDDYRARLYDGLVGAEPGQDAGPRAAAGSPGAAAHEIHEWEYWPQNNLGVRARSEPRLDAERIGRVFCPGELFRVNRIERGSDGIVFLGLADERGWLFDRKPGVGAMCRRVAADAGHARPPSSK